MGIFNFFRNKQQKKTIELKPQNQKQKKQGKEEFPWLMHNKKDLTVDEVTDIEMLLEDDD